MGLWDDDENDESLEEFYQNSPPSNPYLSDPQQSLALIAKLLPRRNRRDDHTEADKAANRLDSLLEGRFMYTVRELGLDSLALSRRMEKLSDQISEYQKIRLLLSKSVVGLGGQFSAGKSSFINSCLGAGQNGQPIILPEDQNPTTSIPTYILGGDEEKIYAYCGSKMIPLDEQAMKAMTHEFFETYGIGFSRFVDNIVIYTNNMPYQWHDKLAFLDTPGYNKADTNARENLRDETLAREQLKAVDYLIWLVSIDNGTLHEGDVKFLQRVPKDTKILVVANKADKKTEAEIEAIINTIEETLDKENIDVFAVTAYSSRDSKEYFGKKDIEDFLELAAGEAKGKRDIAQNIEEIIDALNNNFSEEITKTEKQQYALGEDIYKAREILTIQSLIYFYNSITRHKKRLYEDKKKFDKTAHQIKKAMDRIRS